MITTGNTTHVSHIKALAVACFPPQRAEKQARYGRHVLLSAILCVLSFHQSMGQTGALKVLGHADFAIWNTIQNTQISADGRFVGYRVVPGEGDASLHIYDTQEDYTQVIERVGRFQIDYEQDVFVAIIQPDRDTLRAWERRKKDKKEWPGDTLLIINKNLSVPNADLMEKIPLATGFSMPDKASDFVAFTVKAAAIQTQKIPNDTMPSDSTMTKENKKDGSKKKSKKEIEHLIVRQLSTGRQDTLLNVKQYAWAEAAPVLLAYTEAQDSTQLTGVAYWSNFEWVYIKKQKGEYAKLSPSYNGGQLAFIGNLDTTKAQLPPWELYYYNFKSDSATVIATGNTSAYPLISQHAGLQWSEDGKYLFYGRATKPNLKDTTLLSDELVNVEIWSTQDHKIYTVQNANKANEEKRAYTFVYDTEVKQHIPVTSMNWESAVYSPDRNNRYVLVYTSEPYELISTWTGESRKDIAKLDLLTGAAIPIKKSIITSPRMSPGGKFAYGYSEADSTWWTYQMATGAFRLLNREKVASFSDEENDVPTYPNSYGVAGWISGDQSLIVYDRYDMWAWSPEQGNTAQKITDGRNNAMIHRYIRTDREERAISPQSPWLIHVTDDRDKSSGYTWFHPNGFTLDSVSTSAFAFSKSVTKARLANAIVFEKENFQTFPDLCLSQDGMQHHRTISNVNPQQSEYKWGTIELFHWTDWDSIRRTGLLVKPADYDTMRSYPTIVNFYEKSSDGLHNHPTIVPHRSTINYAFYASRGYVIFNPDISYSTGLPGESAYKTVMSGVGELVKRRIADSENMALQGHSWGGYQIAYIVTRTNQFKCAEAGAAVVNMTSAYGGIRWETGLARQFQYEREQSRLGKSLWDDPQVYIANSPLFKVNKIETPLLLLHNDEDGAVPFEQGIEFYLALRRNGKKAWMLNYPGEPHWPVKLENRKDFQLRMSQFFDHYLKGAAMPDWMAKEQRLVDRPR